MSFHYYFQLNLDQKVMLCSLLNPLPPSISFLRLILSVQGFLSVFLLTIVSCIRLQKVLPLLSLLSFFLFCSSPSFNIPPLLVCILLSCLFFNLFCRYSSFLFSYFLSYFVLPSSYSYFLFYSSSSSFAFPSYPFPSLLLLLLFLYSVQQSPSAQLFCLLFFAKHLSIFTNFVGSFSCLCPSAPFFAG